MKLHFRTLGEGSPLIIMHGVFGSSDNWQTLGKVFSEFYKVYLVDMRNHGNSPHSDEFDYHVMADDIIELMNEESIDAAHILGHSMGGKVAMHLATKNPQRVNKLIVVDIAPKYYPPHHQQIFKGFHSVDLAHLENRRQADEQMSKVIANMGVRQFILKNLHRNKEGEFQWKLNVNAIERSVENVGKGLEDEVQYDGTTLFIAGEKSDYILEEDHEHIKEVFCNAEVITVEKAGHWVHAENPNELGRVVLEFLS